MLDTGIRSEGMKMKTQIFETADKSFRILEIADTDYCLDDLKGDLFDFDKSGYTGTREELREEERQFEEMVSREGVYGYVLERWNPSPGAGYEHVDSCWGFVGQYNPSDRSGTFDHYIVDELRAQIPAESLSA